tara:strand:- start:11807 stop:12193 length:387 start_codon:yes stop_codon:yes gene_type:complete
MTWSRLLFAAAVLAGSASGPSMLTAGIASQPPLTWPALAFVGIFTLVAIPTVLGFQVALRNRQAVWLGLGWQAFLYIGVYAVAGGSVALGLAASESELLPHAFLFLVIGLGVLAGVRLTQLAFLRRKA